jgi:hypothetical protein
MKLYIFEVMLSRFSKPVILEKNANTEEEAIQELQKIMLKLDGSPKVAASAFTLVEVDEHIVDINKEYTTQDGRKVVLHSFNETTRNYSGSIVYEARKRPKFMLWTINGRPVVRNPNNNLKLRLVEKGKN